MARGGKKTFKIRLMAFLVISAVLVAGIVTTESPAWAKGLKDEIKKCDNNYKGCQDRCKSRYEDVKKQNDCMKRTCDHQYLNCIANTNKPVISPTDTTGTPVPPTKAGQNVGKVGGVKKVGEGPSTQPIGKIKSDTGVSGIKKLDEGWSSPSTSGGSTTQRSGRQKRN